MKTLKSFVFVALCLLVSVTVYAGDKNSFLKKQFTTSNGYKLNYRVLYPENYCPDQQYPVILFLHGAGERGDDNEAQLFHGGDMFASHANRSKYPAIIIAPQCPKDISWSSYRKPEKDGEKRYYPSVTPITKPMAAVKELLDSYIAKGIVDTKRIYITGLSMGGMGTFDLVCRYPNLFATATPICGGANLQRLANFKGKTVFSIYHGADDSVVDVQFSRDAYKTLKEAGIDVRYKEYPGVDHNSWDNAFAEPDYLEWMFLHK
ncbi:alpha/beta hydrolase-fold protein [Parabacteroides bouchesdurhonensis]|uniref:carboxylesterase family protein n=1 Tax=Parabacteroides bouchesdurhonensis TaxID=1936995 RepID=UPI000C8171D8|nr:alpha/beta hydrolase-fold protein [Parabacteroides bouchesdurhonensis]